MLIGNMMRTRKVTTLTKAAIREQADLAASLIGDASIDTARLADDLVTRFDVFVQRASILEEEDQHQRWVSGIDKTTWRFWPRCEKYLLGLLPQPVVRQIDEDTNQILDLLGNPAAEGPWDRRGLVVGDVQFGKTSNYSALACKAADAGYKMIIVLAGMHESLRMQTQMRMDEAFLGYRTDHTHAPTGAGLFDPGVRAFAATARSLRGDFNKIMSAQLVLSPDAGPPMLLVVKKNAIMLRNLHSWLDKISNSIDESGTRKLRGTPALIIDDESDNASVDTVEQDFNDGEPDPGHKPTAINGLIRQILELFEKRSYVGYTATPFANIFIHHEGETAKEAKDLFPKNFIVNLHAPSNYFGPIKAFGLESEDEGPSAAPLTRIIDTTEHDSRELDAWVPARHKQTHMPNLDTPEGIPLTLRTAIQSFIIVCAVRKLRGQTTDHNSMLVHVTRFTRVQQVVFQQISDEMVRVRRRLRFGDEKASNSIVEEMRTLYQNDFLKTNIQMREMKFSDIGQMPEWSILAPTLADIANNIRIKQINGLAQDVLDYDSFKDTGIDVIVIGGDKLSRGLTLPGLSVSYFTRQSDMYDTLLQMGRWFGYRTGYLDLCRLYTTKVLNSAFEHIALASDELRREFEYMHIVGKTPRDFGLKVRRHAVLAPTAPNKRRHARDIVLYVSYAGSISESKSFSLDSSVLTQNFSALEQLIRALKTKPPTSPKYDEGDGSQREYASSKLWTDVPWTTVKQFLSGYRTEEAATRASSRLWISYVDRQIQASGELKKWNVVVVSGDPAIYDVAGMPIGGRLRARDTAIISEAGSYHIKRLVTPRDAGVDLSAKAWEEARKFDPLNRLDGKERREPTAFGIAAARQMHNINPLMMIYLPFAEDIKGLKCPVVGVAISFPGSDRSVSETLRYTANKVLQDQIDASADFYDTEDASP